MTQMIGFPKEFATSFEFSELFAVGALFGNDDTLHSKPQRASSAATDLATGVERDSCCLDTVEELTIAPRGTKRLQAAVAMCLGLNFMGRSEERTQMQG